MCEVTEADQEIEVRIAKVVDKGSTPYVVTYPGLNSDAITFARSVWAGVWPPRRGQIAVLSGVERFVGGWRARCARPVLTN